MDGTPEKGRGRKTTARPAETAAETAPPLGAAPAAVQDAQPAEPMRECPGCGREVPRATRECPYCTSRISDKATRCAFCTSEVEAVL